MSQRLVIGIDAGGTTTRVLVADAVSGAPLREARGASASEGGPAVRAPLQEALAACGGASSAAAVSAVCAGITKITRTGVKERWETELGQMFPAARVEVVPDFVIAFHGATGGVGIAVLAGTGSVVYGEDGQGGTARVGGRGWEYGDEGSGAWLTAEMVRRTLRAQDAVAAATPLTDAVCALLGTRDAAELAERARRQAEEAGRGFLLPMAVEEARSGNAEAKNLFVGAAGWLALQAKAVAARLAFAGDEAVPVATVGGLWEAGDLLSEPFGQVLRRWLPRAQIISPRASPVQGAARRAGALR